MIVTGRLKLSDLPLLDLRRSCRPCGHGEHGGCRVFAENDGSEWVNDEKGHRLVRRKWLGYGYEKNPDGSYVEIPRRPCACAQAGHIGEPGTCDRWSRGDNFHGGSRCGKPVKGEITIRSSFISGEFITIPVCGVHLAAQRRVEANQAVRDQKAAETREMFERQKAANRAAEDWAEKLESEFGIPVEPRKGEPIRVELHPEKLYAILSEVRGLLDEVYEDHPFRRGAS